MSIISSPVIQSAAIVPVAPAVAQEPKPLSLLKAAAETPATIVSLSARAVGASLPSQDDLPPLDLDKVCNSLRD